MSRDLQSTALHHSIKLEPHNQTEQHSLPQGSCACNTDVNGKSVNLNHKSLQPHPGCQGQSLNWPAMVVAHVRALPSTGGTADEVLWAVDTHNKTLDTPRVPLQL